MKNRIINILVKSIIWGLVWFGLAALIGFIITKISPDKSFKNILFIEGLVIIFGGIFASISGDPMGISMNYLEAKMKGRKSNVKTDISFALSTFSLLIGGILSVISTFII